MRTKFFQNGLEKQRKRPLTQGAYRHLYVFKDLRVRLVHMWSRTEVGFM